MATPRKFQTKAERAGFRKALPRCPKHPKSKAKVEVKGRVNTILFVWCKACQGFYFVEIYEEDGQIRSPLYVNDQKFTYGYYDPVKNKFAKIAPHCYNAAVNTPETEGPQHERG